LIETYEERVVPIPSTLHLIDTPEDVLEMQTMPNVRLYVTDDSDQLVSVLGDESDPWEVTVSVLSGPGNVLGNITVPFVGGLATFDGIFLDTRGPGYVLEFAISYPANSIIPATASNMFAVGGRPLGLRFNEFNILQPLNTSFAINATIWDEALDQAATADVLVDDWECEATFNNGNFSGSSQVSLSPGEGFVAFDDLIIEDRTLNNKMTIDCFGNNTSTEVKATSGIFHIFDYPTTGLRVSVVNSLKYTGKAEAVEAIIAGFDKDMGTMTCKGCRSAGALPGVKTIGENTEAFNHCWSPLSQC